MLKNIITIQNLDNYKESLKIKRSIHKYLQDSDFLQLELPVLSPSLIPEETIEVFETELINHNKKEKLFLTPSPELFIKRLLTYGIGDCYYLGSSFRNYESLQSDFHFVEFTMLEIYKLDYDYMQMADKVLDMIRVVNKKYHDKNYVSANGKKVYLDKWEKYTVAQAFKKFANINEETLYDKKLFLYEVKAQGYNIENTNYEEAFSQIYSDKIEPNLGISGLPTIIYDFPKEFASLAMMNDDKKTAQRFEFYINGIELGNCFSELANPKEQAERFTESQITRKGQGMINYPQDDDLLSDLKAGLPKVSGIAIGVDRLIMVILDLDNISRLRLVNLSEN